MSSRKQRTKQFDRLTFERIDELFEIWEIQSIVRILIRLIFESELSFFQFITDVQNTVSLSKNVNMIDDVTNQNDFIEQIKQKLTIIKIEKRRVHLRHRLIQIKTKKKNWLFCDCFRNIEIVSKKCRISSSYIIEKKFKVKNVKIIFWRYSEILW